MFSSSGRASAIPPLALRVPRPSPMRPVALKVCPFRFSVPFTVVDCPDTLTT